MAIDALMRWRPFLVRYATMHMSSMPSAMHRRGNGNDRGMVRHISPLPMQGSHANETMIAEEASRPNP